MTSDRYLFLDVDGVLNSHAWFKKFNEENGRNASIAGDREGKGPSEHIDPKTVGRLNRIIVETGAGVVLSSTWRTARSVGQIQELLERSGFIGKVVGKTGHGFNGERGLQILNWLELTGNEKATVVVLDDEQSDMGRVLGWLVKTDGKVGLTDEDVMKAVALLKRGIDPKTAMTEGLLDAAANAARRGKKPLFFTAEMTPRPDVRDLMPVESLPENATPYYYLDDDET